MASAYPVDQPNSRRSNSVFHGDFSPFALLKVRVSEEFERNELEKLAEIFELSPSERDQFNNSTATAGLAFVRILEKKCYFTATYVDRFISALNHIQHHKLVNIVQEYKEKHLPNLAYPRSIPGNSHSFGHHAMNSGRHFQGPATYSTVPSQEVFQPGQDVFSVPDQCRSDQTITFPVRKQDYPNCHGEILEKLIREGSKIQDRSFQGFFGKQRPNPSQSEALRRALSHPFTVIQGPPGTGKTRTGVYLTSFFAQINRKVFPRTVRSQILYCGPSNKSVDVITEYLQKFENKNLKFVRVYSDTIEQKTYPIPGVESAERKFGLYDENTQMSEEVKKHALHHLIRSNEAGGDGKKIQQMDAQFRERKLEPTLQNVRDYKKLVENTKLAILKKRDIILCTCSTAGHYMFKENLNIVQCIIDEAGMCFELDTLIPLVTQQPKQVVFIGDHKQLRHSVLKFQGIAYTLTIQYRMHEEICKFPSKEFYNSKLETDESVRKRGQVLPPGIWPGNDHQPRVFCHIEGKEDAQTVTTTTAEGNEMSRSNEKEANEVVRMAKALAKQFNVNVKPCNLIILSQYKLQVMLIKKKLKQHSLDVKVQTIIKSQGSEWDFVILSTVRSLPEEDIPESPGKSWKRQNLGFIEDEHQMNVGLTRAKRGLIIVGNKHLLNTCSKWRELIKHYDETNSVVEAVQFPNC